MNHARCPACQTLFRVTAEQLEARGGRVRCGQCANVFNALESPLVLEPREALASPQEPDAFHPIEHDLNPASEAEPLPAVLVSNRREPDPLPLYEETAPLEAEAREYAESLVAEDVTPALRDISLVSVQAEWEVAEAKPLLVEPPDTGVTAEEHEAGHDVQASGVEALSAVPEEAETLAPIVLNWPEGEQAPVGTAPLVPAAAGHGASRLWGVALAFLALAAALQVVWVFRSDLAMAYPDLRPQFVAWCQGLGCDMPLPRQSGQIGIEASELRPASQGQGLLKLSATLRNRAAFPQAYPDLELTLTDTEDKALARRVFTPKELLGAKADQADGFPANGDLPISLTLDTSAISAAGYRLYVFYP